MRALLSLLALVSACGTCGDGRPDPFFDRVGACGLSVGTEWPRHSIVGGYDGADGSDECDFDDDGFLDLVTPWEQQNAITLSFHPGTSKVQGHWPVVRRQWPTVSVTFTGATGVEDARCGDLNDDGTEDIVWTEDNGQQVWVAFAPTSTARSTLLDFSQWTLVQMANAPAQNTMQAAIADVDDDGEVDVLIGGRAVATPKWGWLKSPGAGSYTTGSAWAWNEEGDVGWTMSLIFGSFGGAARSVFISDRTNDVGLRGVRWLENDGSQNFTNHTIDSLSAGNEVKFCDVQGTGAGAVITCTVSDTLPTNFIRIYTADDASWSSFTTVATLNPPTTNVGRAHDVDYCDVDGDAVNDMVVGFSNCDGGLSCVVWLKGPTYATRGEISGGEGEKFDAVLCHDVDGDGDPDVVTSDQEGAVGPPTEVQHGAVWFENRRICL